MQIVVNNDDHLVFISDGFDATEWPALWAQAPAEYEVLTYDVWPDDIIAAVLSEGRTLTYEFVTHYVTVQVNGQWMTIPLERALYHFSPVQSTPQQVPPADTPTV